MFLQLSRDFVPWVAKRRVFLRQRIKGEVQLYPIPDRPRIDALWGRHPALFDHQVEQAR